MCQVKKYDTKLKGKSFNLSNKAINLHFECALCSLFFLWFFHLLENMWEMFSHHLVVLSCSARQRINTNYNISFTPNNQQQQIKSLSCNKFIVIMYIIVRYMMNCTVIYCWSLNILKINFNFMIRCKQLLNMRLSFSVCLFKCVCVRSRSEILLSFISILNMEKKKTTATNHLNLISLIWSSWFDLVLFIFIF